MLAAAFLVASAAVAAAQHLEVRWLPAAVVDGATTGAPSGSGSFDVLLDGQRWLSAREVRAAGGFSSAEASLHLVGWKDNAGQDELGSYKAKTLSWASNATLGSAMEVNVLMETSVRSYPGDKGLLVFEQRFPQELDLRRIPVVGSSGGKLAAATLFPGFQRPQAASSEDLACFAYHGIFPQLHPCTLSNYSESHQGGTPWVVYNASNTSLPMLVLAPLNYPKAQHMASSATVIGAGVKATCEIIPAGWSQKFVLSAGYGINDGMMAWGDRMLKFTGKKRTDLYRDRILSTIGFWTDNGGYYHYATGSNRTYEEVLPEVKAYHDKLGVPFGHWQFDSWFYPKDGGVDAGGGGGAVTNWTALPSVFPSGMAAIQSKLKVPMVMHNRQWSPKSDYVHNLPFKWYKSEKAAIAEDPVAFFAWFFHQQDGWGLGMYEQDWMCKEYDLVKALQTNISLGDLWLYGMAAGAAGSGRTVQYCMPYAHDVISAAAYPAVTNARATGDYFHSSHQWAIGGTAMFYWALGIIPFKDGFYSSSAKQVGGQTEGPEKDPDRETLMAVLSGAMVGPMDGIGLLNRSRVMATCRGDGVLLKPDKPVTVTDECFRLGNATCAVYHTYSDIPGWGRVHYHFSDEAEVPLTPAMVYLPVQESSAPPQQLVYNWYSGQVSVLRAVNHVAPGYEGHVFATVSPVRFGWVFLGEVDKYVTASTTRFPAVIAADDGAKLLVTVKGVAGEVVKVCAVSADSLQVVCQTAAFKEDAELKVTFAMDRALHI